MNRRRFLAGVAVGGAAAIAGCTDGGTNAGPADGPTVTETADGGGSGGTGDGGTGQVSGDGGDGADQGSVGDDDGGGGTGSDGSSGSPALADVGIRYDDSYAFSIDFGTYEGRNVDMTMDGRWHEGDLYYRSVVDGEGSMEFYSVSGTQYVSTGRYCVANPGQGQIPNAGVDGEEWASTDDQRKFEREYGSVAAAGTATVDGVQCWVYELTPTETGIDSTYTFYVGVDDGYVRRAEIQGVVIEYYDWGATDPIGAPC